MKLDSILKVIKPKYPDNRHKTDDSGEKEVALLGDFFSRIGAGALFESEDSNDLGNLRDALQNAVIQLLDFKRPYLEAEKGLQWPYDAFRKCKPLFEDMVQKGTSSVLKTEALLFLARLPFPGQWEYLIEAEQALHYHPEIRNLHRFETENIQQKIRNRAQKTYRIRRFCQILKRPRLPTEKGVLRIFSLLYLFIDKELLEQLNRHYVLYIEPTAGVMCRHTWLRAFSQLSDPCIFGVAGKEDTGYIDSQPGIATTRLAHADFLQDDTPAKAHCEKQFDIVFVGTFDEMRRKRHLRMLELLLHPKLSDATALIIGQGSQTNIGKFNETVQQYGLSDRVTVLSNRPRKEIPDYLSRCRIAVHLALHENGCRCIYEYFRSDVPCVISSYTAGVNFNIFNSKTGMAVPDTDLAETVCYVLENTNSFSPRQWFLSESGSTNGSARLNSRFKEFFSHRGYDWTEDIVPLGSGGANRYVTASDYERFRPDFQMLYDIFTRKTGFPVKLSMD
jgi:glycosyltransferase involved in cell wall biosynthesis